MEDRGFARLALEICDCVLPQERYASGTEGAILGIRLFVVKRRTSYVDVATESKGQTMTITRGDTIRLGDHPTRSAS